MHLPVTLSAGAPAGTWTIEVKADPALPPIGRAEFRVDAFVPDRMAVDLGAGNGPIVPGRPYSLPVTARFLFGAPAAGLTGQAQMRLLIDPAPFPALAGYRIGLVNETYAPDSQDLTLPDTDAQGHSTLAISVPRAPDTTHALKASITAGVNDPSGHASLAATEIPVRPAGRLIGIKPAFADDAVDAGTEAAFDIAAVNPDGARTALKAKLRLVRERPDWRLVMNGSLARYETVWRDEPLETRAIDIPADTPLRVARSAGFRPLPHRGAGGWRHGRHIHAVPRRLGVVGQPRRAGPGGRLGRPQGLRARRHRAHPHRPAVRRRGDAAGAVRSRPFGAQPGGAGRRHRCRCAGVRRLGHRRLCHGARVPHGGGREIASQAVPSDWPGSASIRACASCRWRSRRRTTIRRGRVRDPAAHRAWRLGQSRRGGRGHPAADQIRLARSVRSFPRPSPAWSRHPRRLGPTDRAA